MGAADGPGGVVHLAAVGDQSWAGCTPSSCRPWPWQLLVYGVETDGAGHLETQASGIGHRALVSALAVHSRRKSTWVGVRSTGGTPNGGADSDVHHPIPSRPARRHRSPCDRVLNFL